MKNNLNNMNYKLSSEIERIKSELFKQKQDQYLKDKQMRKEQRRMKKLFMVQSILMVFLVTQLAIIILLTN